MSKSEKKIPAAMVKRGMYVTKLDRHWLESPFLFQGFYVDSEDQIDKLKTTCKYVYVDGEHHGPETLSDLPWRNPGYR